MASTLGWDSRAMACASRNKRVRISSISGSPEHSAFNSLTAIFLSNLGSYAAYTTPIPPRPISRSTSYCPASAFEKTVNSSVDEKAGISTDKMESRLRLVSTRD